MAVEAVAVDKQSKKNLKKKLRKKLKKKEQTKNQTHEVVDDVNEHSDINVEIDYVPEPIGQFLGSHEFIAVFEKFKFVEISKSEEHTNSLKEDPQSKPKEVPIKARGFLEEDDEIKQEDSEEKPKPSKKKLKKLNRLHI